MKKDWESEIVPSVFFIVGSGLSQRDACALLCINTTTRNLLSSHSLLWKVLDLHGKNKAGERLQLALSLQRFQHVEEINLEFAQELEDHHLKSIRCEDLKILNLNACQKISNNGVKTVAASCPKLESFSIYWNLRITDNAVEVLVKSCKNLMSLNFSGCKKLTDESLQTIAQHCSHVKYLNLTRCVQLTDTGLIQLLESCVLLEELYLYAVSSFSEKSYGKLYHQQQLKVLDLCGAQGLTDHAVIEGMAFCRKLESLNLTWCVQITDSAIKAIAKNCHFIKLLSLHGLLGITDEGMRCLAETCSNTLTTIDVSGCVNIKRRSKSELLELFPKLTTFNVHS